jgi:hypothetical protein
VTRLLVLVALLQGCGNCSGETGATTGGHDAAPSASEAAAAPPHKVEAGPDTSFDALPDAGVADLQLRGKHLLQAIAENDASLAADILIPRAAFVSARDVQGDPGAVFESKLQPSLSNQIARIRRHEKGIDGAVFVSFDLGGAPTKVEPHRHEWKIPVWTIRHSKLTFTVDGRVRRVEIAEMIAWRGNWYVSRIREGR